MPVRTSPASAPSRLWGGPGRMTLRGGALPGFVDRTGSPLQPPQAEALALGPRVALETLDYPSLWLTDRSVASHKPAPPLPVPPIFPSSRGECCQSFGGGAKGAHRPALIPPLPRPIFAGPPQTLVMGRCTLQ